MNNQGYVYVLMNPSLEGLVKVGRTTRDPEDRIHEISSATGVPTPFILVYKEFTRDCVIAEKMIHISLDNHRVSSNREFFRLPIYEAIKCVQNICAEVGTSDNFDSVEEFNSTNSNDLAGELLHRGKVFYYGLGDELEDNEEALNLFKKAAQLGSVEAHRLLGEMYAAGSGCRADVKQALDYYKKGASLGDRSCFAEMATVYLYDNHYKNARSMEKCWEMFFKALENEPLSDLDVQSIRTYINSTIRNDVKMTEEHRNIIIRNKDQIIQSLEDSIERLGLNYPDTVHYLNQDMQYIKRTFHSKDLKDSKDRAIIKELQVYKGKAILRSKIKTGQLKIGDRINIYNNNGSYIALIDRIDKKGRNVELANVDDYVGILVTGEQEELSFLREYKEVFEDTEVKGYIELIEI